MIKETEAIRMLIEIDQAPIKHDAIRKKVLELLDRMEGPENEAKCQNIEESDQITEQNAQKEGEDAQEAEDNAQKEEKGEADAPGSEDKPLLRAKNLGKDKSGGVRKNIDIGKLHALRRAGWKVKDIADELGCSQAAVYQHLKGSK